MRAPLRLLAFAHVALAAALLGSGCASSPPPEPPALGEVPSAEDLYQEGLATLRDGREIWFIDTTDYQGAIEIFQEIVDNYPYSEYEPLAQLRIADAYYEQELYEEALSYYKDFSELHPEHEKVPYTISRTARAYYHKAKGPERDQTATRKAIAQLERLMERHPHAPETAEAEKMWRELRARLGRHAMDIGDFYLERSEYQSAAHRYRSVLNDFPGLGFDAEALYKLGIAYTEMNREDEANRLFRVILRNYEGSEMARAAQELVPAAN